MDCLRVERNFIEKRISTWAMAIYKWEGSDNEDEWNARTEARFMGYKYKSDSDETNSHVGGQGLSKYHRKYDTPRGSTALSTCQNDTTFLV